MRLFSILAVIVALFGGYTWVVLNWSYSSGERAGYVQKFSHKGWFCKTWEGELAMVTMPGTLTEKFEFSVRDPDVARRLNESMGQRVSLHYAQHVGVPTSCFGETQYYVSEVRVVDVSEAERRLHDSMPALTPPAAAPAQ
ncbi:MAG: hypothetical protein KKD25_06345 [Gammaproteobacteria bacterium]|jgi:hypothetical protein|nr:hypothetical protein [Gammaproteobacteria bacterium]MBU0772213.1 hypothetical protein [Gammaproteobacteria bacterium]MBU0855276.1 hypothetical protein [Gammaproteobacteria bacterium]MBU1848340.1 hypothetical protein [Gammaproteobacteria bacterium]